VVVVEYKRGEVEVLGRWGVFGLTLHGFDGDEEVRANPLIESVFASHRRIDRPLPGTIPLCLRTL
jgi:hypothetical protein